MSTLVWGHYSEGRNYSNNSGSCDVFLQFFWFLGGFRGRHRLSGVELCLGVFWRALEIARN